MRIACLQFAPKLGDHDNNINRADGILSRARPRDLDLLVLPELTFTGSTFKSSEAIAPYLQHAGSGITSLWARTIGLKYGCVVVAGYPEKADVSSGRSASLRYYNSAIAVNASGETLANYRKTFLDTYDKPWASEGPDEFFQHGAEELSNVAIAIGMDINPYENKAPWMAWEFAYHVLHKQSNIVILLMAWLTPDNLNVCSSNEREPDMNVLAYWISRLEPLIRAEDEGEIIVIIANRCGSENDAVYAGTSCVLGIQDGEVRVYGILGRGDRDLLVVDTSKPPLHNLVTHTNAQGQRRTIACRINNATDRNRVYTCEQTHLNTFTEGRKTVGSIDSVLAANAEFQQHHGQISYGFPAYKQEVQPQVCSRNTSSQYPVIEGERSLKNMEILPSKDAGLQRYGLSDETSSKSASSTKINGHYDQSVPDAPEAKPVNERSAFSGSKDALSVSLEQSICLPESSSLPDSGCRYNLPPLDIVFPIDSAPFLDSAYLADSAYPGDSACPSDSAYYPNSAYPPNSVYSPDSAYYPQSAASMTRNVPRDQKSNRIYYGDKELMKFMKDVNLRNKTARPRLDSVESSELLTDEEPRSAISPDSAYPPQSASSMIVNVPWESLPAKIGCTENRGVRDDKAIDRRRVTDSKNDFKYNRQSLALAIPSRLGSTYELESARSGSAYSLGSGVSMIVNAPWEPQTERRFYGDQELLKVMGTSAALRIYKVLQESTRATQPAKSLITSYSGLGNSVTSHRTYTGIRGTDEAADKYPSIPKVKTPGHQSPQPASLALDLAPPSQSSVSPDETKRNAIILSPQSTEAVFSEAAAAPVEYCSLRNNAMESNLAPTESLVSQTHEPFGPTVPMVEITDGVLSLVQLNSTATEKSPDSAHSIIFEMPQIATNDLFPGEGIISPTATAKTNSSGSGHASFLVADDIKSLADLLQSPTSDRSVENSDNSLTPPDNTSSTIINQSWDSALMPFGFEELIDQPVSSVAVNSADLCPSSTTPPFSPELMIDSFCNPRAVPFVALAQHNHSNRGSNSEFAPVLATDRRDRFTLSSIFNLLRRTINMAR